MSRRFAVFTLSAILVAVASGCGDRSSLSSKAARPGNAKKSAQYEALSANDVIVTVDGSALTKSNVEERVNLTIALARISGRYPGDLNKPIVRNRLVKNEISRFIVGRILLNAARAEKISELADARELASRQVVGSYGEEGESYEAFVKRLNVKYRAALQEKVDEAAMIFSFIHVSAGDSAKVTEAEIDEIVAHGRKLESESKRLLAEQRQKAVSIHERLVAGESFEQLAADSFTAGEDGGNGEWGSYTKTALEFHYPEVAKAVASLQKGEFTQPLELDDGIYIVKLYEREGAGAESAVTLNPEMLTLGRIVLPLPMMYEESDRDSIKYDLLNRKLTRFQSDKLLPELRSKAKISYPHGQIVYKTNQKKGN